MLSCASSSMDDCFRIYSSRVPVAQLRISTWSKCAYPPRPVVWFDICESRCGNDRFFRYDDEFRIRNDPVTQISVSWSTASEHRLLLQDRRLADYRAIRWLPSQDRCLLIELIDRHTLTYPRGTRPWSLVTMYPR